MLFGCFRLQGLLCRSAAAGRAMAQPAVVDAAVPPHPPPPRPSFPPLLPRSGRKRAALLYCLTYSLGCVTKHFNSFWILAGGRVLCGVATSLLFSAFESWLVAEHFKVRLLCRPCLGAAGWVAHGHWGPSRREAA